MAQTLCPKCGLTPIPDYAEACPRCGEPFSYLPEHKKKVRMFAGGKDPEDTLSAESTTFGGNLTGAVSARPLPAAAVLAMGAVIWFLRVGGVFEDLGDPIWAYAIVGVDLVFGTVLILNLGPAKTLAEIAGVAEIALAFVLSQGELGSALTLAYAAHGVIVVFTLVREPSPLRSAAGVILGALTSLVAVALLLMGAGLK